MRERIRLTITTGNTDNWDKKTCCEAMKNKKYKAYKHLAWIQYAKINKYLAE